MGVYRCLLANPKFGQLSQDLPLRQEKERLDVIELENKRNFSTPCPNEFKGKSKSLRIERWPKQNQMRWRRVSTEEAVELVNQSSQVQIRELDLKKNVDVNH